MLITLIMLILLITLHQAGWQEAEATCEGMGNETGQRECVCVCACQSARTFTSHVSGGCAGGALPSTSDLHLILAGAAVKVLIRAVKGFQRR